MQRAARTQKATAQLTQQARAQKKAALALQARHERVVRRERGKRGRRGCEMVSTAGVRDRTQARKSTNVRLHAVPRRNRSQTHRIWGRRPAAFRLRQTFRSSRRFTDRS